MPDPYRAPSPTGTDLGREPCPLAFEVAPVRPGLEPGQTIVTHVVVRVRAETPPIQRARPHLSAMLVLDVSGSMAGEPLAQVLHSATRLARILEDTDKLGVTIFSDSARTVAQLRPLGESRASLVAALGSVRASGRTNISGGLAEASLQFAERRAGERHVLVLMSDGEPNLGGVTREELGEQALLIKHRQIAISTLGFGAKHNDEILGEIADRAGGRYTFVIDPKLSESSFIQALGAQLDVVSEGNSVLLSPGEHTEIVRVLEDPPSVFGAGGLKVSIPDLVTGDAIALVVELRVRVPHEPGPLRALVVTLAGQHAGTNRGFRTSIDVTLLGTRVGGEATDPAAHAAVSVARAAELRGKARALADRGSFNDAEVILRQAQQILEQTPGFVSGSATPLADAFEALADDILVMARHPARDEYEVYRRAQRDHLDFAAAGAKVRSGGKLGELAPSSRALLSRARAEMPAIRARLSVLTGPAAGQVHAITKDRFVIGRGAQMCDLTLADPSVSRQHSIIEIDGGAFWLVDMGSTNGPVVNGQRVARHELKDGDLMWIGGSQIRYETEREAGPSTPR